jgi:arabinosyltransferase
MVCFATTSLRAFAAPTTLGGTGRHFQTAFAPSSAFPKYSLHFQLQPRARIGSCLHGKSSTLVVRASWGADVEFNSARILETSKAADNLHRLLIDIGPTAAASYTTPGQFLQAKVNDSKPGFFAIASPPDTNNAGVVELLVKDQGGTAELLCRSAAGDEIQVSVPMGKGFRLNAIPPETHPNVYLFATGSGISPIKAVIESGALNAPKRESCVLYFGVRSMAAMPYADELHAWATECGVKVVPVFSEEGKGYVQDAFVRDGGVPAGAGASVAALLCGQKGMAEAVTATLTESGVAKESILTNF